MPCLAKRWPFCSDLWRCSRFESSNKPPADGNLYNSFESSISGYRDSTSFNPVDQQLNSSLGQILRGVVYSSLTSTHNRPHPFPSEWTRPGRRPCTLGAHPWLWDKCLLGLDSRSLPDPGPNRLLGKAFRRSSKPWWILKLCHQITVSYCGLAWSFESCSNVEKIAQRRQRVLEYQTRGWYECHAVWHALWAPWCPFVCKHEPGCTSPLVTNRAIT